MKTNQIGAKITDEKELAELKRVIEWHKYTKRCSSDSDFIKKMISAFLKSSLEAPVALRKPTNLEYKQMQESKEIKNENKPIIPTSSTSNNSELHNKDEQKELL